MTKPQRDRRLPFGVAAALLACPFFAEAQPPGATPRETLPTVDDVVRLAAAGDLVDALAAAERMAAEDGAPDSAFAILGGLLVEAGRFDRALEVLQPLAEREGADPAALYNAGRAAEGLGRLEDAAAWYRRSLDVVPQSPAARALGMLLGRNGRPQDAYVLLQAWARANPGDIEARKAAAAGAVALERATEAVALLDGLPADDIEVKLLRAQTKLQRGEPWGAISELRESVDTAPQPIQAGLRRTLARAFLLVGDAEGALAQLESSETSGAEDAILLASAYFQAEKLDQAIQALAPFAEPLGENELMMDVPPSVAHRLALEYGRYLHSAGASTKAARFLRLATDIEPSSPDAFQALSQALAANGERDEARLALDRFRAMTAEAPDDVAVAAERRRDLEDPVGRGVRSALERARGDDIEEALGILRREAQLAPNDPRPEYAASSILLNAGRSDEALAAAERALRAAPGRADGLYQRGAVLISLDRLGEAEEMFRQALAAQPDHPAALSDYAVLLMGSDRGSEAIPLLERRLEKRPGDDTARGHLERLLRLGGNATADAEQEARIQAGRQAFDQQEFGAAEAELRRAVASQPEDAALRIDLGAALWENNRPAEAEVHLREAVALDPSSAVANRVLGGLLLWRGDHLGAAASLERAVTLGNQDPDLLLELARAWEGAAGETGDAEEGQARLANAAAAYRQAETLMPESKEAVYGLAQVLRRLGNDEEAEARMNRYRELYERDQRSTRERGLAASSTAPDEGQ